MILSEVKEEITRTTLKIYRNLVPYSFIATAFLLASYGLNAQTEAQLTSELNRRGIDTVTEINDALKAQGMTESEARKMAKSYGINYDDYISKYILKKGVSAPKQNLKENNDNINPQESITETVTKISYSTEDFVENTNAVNPPKINKTYFGYEIFQNNPFANKDYLIGNIDENYIVGPGDEIRIYVWGSHAYQAQVKIDLNGNIALPDNGVFFASGYKFETLKKKLSVYLSKSYSGLNSTPQTSFIDVSLTQLRPVSITVLGESNAPGPHLVNGLASVLNALYASGGVKTSGSLREINVYRDNKLIKTVDLYDYITKGKLTENVRLMNNDVIFIPVRNNSITLNGAVKKSGIFELKNNEGLNELIDIAGGFRADASLKNIKLNRIKPLEERNEEDIYHRFISSINFAELSALQKNYVLNDNDIISVPTVLDKTLNQAKLIGPVNRPGTYSISEFPDIKSLILEAGDSLKPRVYMNRLNLYRFNEDGTRNFFTFNLKNIIDGVENFDLKNEDIVELFGLNKTEGDDRRVSISGFGSDGKKSYNWNENFTLYDLIFQNVSIDDKEFQTEVLDSRVDINRFNVETGMYFKKSFNLGAVISRKENEFLKPRDHITLYSKNINRVLNQVVTVMGYVKNPGVFKLTEGMSAEDLILLAGGYTEYALKNEVTITRPKFDVDLGKISEDFKVRIDSSYIMGYKKIKDKNSFYVKHRDVISVKKLPGVESLKSVTITGEVRFPGSVSINNKNENLREIINKVGGITPFGTLKSSYIQRDGNRFVLDLNKAYKKNASFLNDGDRIHIGENSGVVKLNGAVANDGLFVWQPNKRLKNYVKLAGSYERPIEKVVIEYPNGIIIKKRWYSNPKVLPNSKIYVYSKPEKEKNERNGNGMDKFIEVLTVITGALTTIVLTRAL